MMMLLAKRRNLIRIRVRKLALTKTQKILRILRPEEMRNLQKEQISSVLRPLKCKIKFALIPCLL